MACSSLNTCDALRPENLSPTCYVTSRKRYNEQQLTLGFFDHSAAICVSQTPQNFVADLDVRHNVASLSRKFSKSH